MTRPSHFDPWWHNWPLALAVAVGLALGIVGVGHAGTVTLAWDAVSDPAVTGYKLHYGNTPGTYTVHKDVGNVTTSILTLGTGVWYISATAYAGTLESDYSNEVSVTLKPKAPGNMKVTQTTVTLTFDRNVVVMVK